jgi:hypothetical protein
VKENRPARDIHALGFAAFVRIRADTLCAATDGEMGLGTIAALDRLLTELVTRANVWVVIATDAENAGKRYVIQLSQLGANVGVSTGRALPTDSLNDWTDVLKARTGRGLR